MTKPLRLLSVIIALDAACPAVFGLTATYDFTGVAGVEEIFDDIRFACHTLPAIIAASGGNHGICFME